MFVHLQRFPERERRFANTMVEMTSTEGYGVYHLVDGYPWEEVEGTVVDVRGSRGHASIAISRKSPAAQFVVQDVQGEIEQGRAALPPALAGRITFQTHDFFTAQPVSADVYLLRFILHDHPDAQAVKILQNLLPAMKKGVVSFLMKACCRSLYAGEKRRANCTNHGYGDDHYFQCTGTSARGLEEALPGCTSWTEIAAYFQARW